MAFGTAPIGSDPAAAHRRELKGGVNSPGTERREHRLSSGKMPKFRRNFLPATWVDDMRP
jgi:hypothetical protein